MSLPVTLKMALQAAGRMGGSPGLPSPASGLSIDQRHRQRASGVGIFQAANFGDLGRSQQIGALTETLLHSLVPSQIPPHLRHKTSSGRN
jgi:hypothetical protein